MLDVVSSENREKTLRFVLTFYRQATDRLPTHYQQSAHCRPTVGQQVAYISGKTCRPTDDQLLANRGSVPLEDLFEKIDHILEL